MKKSALMKELEETLRIPAHIKNLTIEEAEEYLKKQKPSRLRSLLIGESSLDPRDVDSIINKDLPENVLKEFHPAFAKIDEE